MHKTIFSLMLFCLSVNVSMQFSAAAPAPKKPDLEALMAGAQTAREKSQVLIVAAKLGQFQWMSRNQKGFFDTMLEENAMGKLSPANADKIIAEASAKFVKTPDGLQFNYTFHENYQVIRLRMIQF